MKTLVVMMVIMRPDNQKLNVGELRRLKPPNNLRLFCFNCCCHNKSNGTITGTTRHILDRTWQNRANLGLNGAKQGKQSQPGPKRANLVQPGQLGSNKANTEQTEKTEPNSVKRGRNEAERAKTGLNEIKLGQVGPNGA